MPKAPLTSLAAISRRKSYPSTADQNQSLTPSLASPPKMPRPARLPRLTTSPTNLNTKMCVWTIYTLWRHLPASVTMAPYFPAKGRWLTLLLTIATTTTIAPFGYIPRPPSISRWSGRRCGGIAPSFRLMCGKAARMPPNSGSRTRDKPILVSGTWLCNLVPTKITVQHGRFT